MLVFMVSLGPMLVAFGAALMSIYSLINRQGFARLGGIFLLIFAGLMAWFAIWASTTASTLIATLR